LARAAGWGASARGIVPGVVVGDDGAVTGSDAGHTGATATVTASSDAGSSANDSGRVAMTADATKEIANRLAAAIGFQ
jgi:hypothetical protein